MLDTASRETTPSFSQADLTDVLWRRKWMLLGSICVTIALGGIYYFYAQPTYSVSSRVLVQPEGGPLVEGASSRHELEFLATQGEILGSAAVIGRAVSELDQPLVLEPGKDPVLAVQAKLTVKPVAGTNVLSLQYQSQDAQQGIQLVGAVLESYRQFSQKRSADSRLEALELLTRSEERLRRELEDQERQYREFRKQSPLIGQGRSAGSFQSTLLEQFGQALTDARNKRINLQNRMELLRNETEVRLAAIQPVKSSTVTVFRVPNDPAERATAVNRELAFDSSLAGNTSALELIGDIKLSGAPDAAAIFRELFLAEVRCQDLALDFGPDHPDVISSRQEVAAWKNRLAGLNEQAHVVLQREIVAAVNNENRLQELYDQECAKAKANDEYLVIEKQELDAIERLTTMHGSLVVQLNNLRLLQPDEDGVLRANMTVLEAPTIGAGPIWPKASVLLILCGLIGTLVGLGMIVVVERDAWDQVDERLMATSRASD